MKVGVLIPAHNVRTRIEMALTTVMAQTYPAESYVVDDASDDGTYEFLSARPSWYTQLAHNPERLGWPATLNAAATLAIDDGCQALFLMNADDFLRLDCIQKCVTSLEGVEWVIPYTQQIGAENVVQSSKQDATLDDFRERSPFVAMAMIRSVVWQAVGGFSLDVTMPGSFGYYEDWEFWIKVFAAGYHCYAVISEPVYYYVMHDEQLHKVGLPRHEEAVKLILDKHQGVFS